MTTRRFYIPPESIQDGMAVLSPAEARHLRKVLRIRPGERVELFDGRGNGYTGIVGLRGPDVCIDRLEKIAVRESPGRLIVAAALIKPARFEWMLEKAAELAADEIIPLQTRYSAINLPDSRIASRAERWKRIVTEASRQSGRYMAPRVHPPVDFDDFVAMEAFAQCSRVLFHEKAEEPWRPDCDQLSEQVAVCIGPEGGWEDREIQLAAGAGFMIRGLGPLTLRAETAVIAALALLRHHVHMKGRWL
ncbi:MAG TPA: RsmE family RNA methyltransferase [Acidobacteriota bacterium]|nr:RsmE family RNA methyltransferase [Acidobacteriota bacterium]